MPALSPLATRVAVRNVEVVDDVCRSAFGCGGIDVATIALLAATTILAFLVIATVFHTTEAGALLEEELRRLAAERDAFTRFRGLVADIEASEATAAVPVTGGIATGSGTITTESLDQVRDAYRGTVMDVAHYEGDYGEPLADNLAAEFGEDVAVAVVEGSRLTPQLKAALLRSSQEAAQRRDSLLSTLQSESASLESAEAVLEEVDAERAAIDERPPSQRSFEGLVTDWQRLGTLADRCRRLVGERQDRLRELSASMPPGRPELHAYLYEDLPVKHPVLADGAALVESVEDLRGRVLQSLTRRV